MKLKHERKVIFGREKERISITWGGYGFTRDFDTQEEAIAYIQGIRDSQSAILNSWEERNEYVPS